MGMSSFEANGVAGMSVTTQQVCDRVNTVMPTIAMGIYQVVDELNVLDRMGVVTNSTDGTSQLTPNGQALLKNSELLDEWRGFEDLLRKLALPR